ncbi:non-secretory ribonuclease-like [Choloepus didactylus]|uniref:non-secretory ribonuclease-like n=1 Tax=Choloepus didactylus TaxID=27675 RepID=UPI00189CCC2A|nr:non-secretory ribonuclease-like [Choloepus didactylus]
MGDDSRLCLLVMLGLWAIVGSFRAPPRGLTRAQWFNIQHVQMAHPRCDDAMRVVNRYRHSCKRENSFLHIPYENVTIVCSYESITCMNGSQNCHQSRERVSLTDCNLTRWNPDYKRCRYRQSSAQKFYVVACMERDPRDPPQYPVVPVHLDDIR